MHAAPSEQQPIAHASSREAHRAHVRFLESMDLVHRAIQGTNDIDQMMSDVLDAVMTVFGCDRALLAYPCDPETKAFRIPMRRARPGFPCLLDIGVDYPGDADVLDVFRSALAAARPVRLGAGAELAVPLQLHDNFDVQAALVMAIFPKGDKPYQFIIHQCSYARVFTSEEQRLFQEIGRRLADALTTMITVRDLRRSEARLDEAARITHATYTDRDVATGMISTSEEGLRILGLPQTRGPVHISEVLTRIHPDDRDRITSLTREEQHTGNAQYDLEYRVVKPSGEVRIVHSRGEVVRDDRGTATRVVGIVQDVTQHKRVEAALHRAQAELAHMARVTTLSEIASSIAHEVNQPLTAIVMGANACRRWLALDPPDLEEARNALQRVIGDGNRASAVIARIRALLRRGEPLAEPLDVNELIYDTLTLVRAEVTRQQIEIKTDLCTAAGTIMGDRVQLQQVLVNLILNAADAMSSVPPGQRELIIRSRARKEDGALVDVQDAGIGIRDNDVDKIFDAFYSTKVDGLGMGLSISRSIIESHSGRLWATANDGPGATFHFTLPPAA